MLLIYIFSVIGLAICVASSPWEDYVECREEEKFGNLSLICDPEHKLQRRFDKWGRGHRRSGAFRTVEKLDSLLRDLQNKISCECANGCDRGSGSSDKYLGLLLVTTSAKVNESTKESLNDTSRRIYEDARLGNADCNNGLLIVYIKDKQQLATYRGSGRFTLLSDKDMAKLNELANNKDVPSDDSNIPVRYLLGNNDEVGRERPGVPRAESLAPIIGLTVALVVILIIVALLISFVLAKLLGCCYARRSDRKVRYDVTPTLPPSYRSIEPIYIITPPRMGESMASSRSRHPTNDRFYHSTPSLPPNMRHGPYSPVYPPPPPPLSPLPPLPRPIVTFPPPRSRSATPTSRSRIRVHPKYSSSAHGSVKSPDQTPQANKREKVARTSTTASNATYYTPGTAPTKSGQTTEQSTSEQNQLMASTSQGRIPSPLRPQYSTTISDTESSGFSFLDPKRKQEVQTREKYIG